MLNQTNTTILSNGAAVVSSASPEMESVTFGIWVAAGGRYETPACSGVSHLLEHMLFKGTPKRSAVAISRAIEGRGGYMNAFTQEESTCYYMRLPYERLRQGFDVLSDMFLHASLDANDLERERGVIMEEIKMYQDQPQHLVQEALQEGMFIENPLGMPLAGSVESLQAMDQAFLFNYKERAYAPAATVFSFAGRVKHEKCVAYVEQAMQGWSQQEGLTYTPVDSRTPQHALVVKKRDISQAHAALGFRVFGRGDERRHVLRVLNCILGENMSSRLYQSVRERRGLCYAINSWYQLFAETGIFTISGGFDANRLDAALKLIVKELRRLINSGVGMRELERARSYLTGSFRLGFEGSGSQMIFIGDSMINHGKIIHPEEILAGINAVTADDIQQVAADIFNSSAMTLSLVIPESMKAKERQWLAITSI